jgi:hypothetical protein
MARIFELNNNKVNRGVSSIKGQSYLFKNAAASVAGDDRIWFSPYALSRHLVLKKQVLLPLVQPIYIRSNSIHIEVDVILE